MGAAAFIMVVYLNIPLRDVLAAALFPALLHYFGIFVMVHLEAKKLGLRGLRAEELPKALVVLREHWLALVPFVFVYSPALLLVADGFTWWVFTGTLAGAMLGIGALGVSFSGYLFAPLYALERWYVALVAFLFIAPGLTTTLIGLALLAPIVLLQIKRRGRAPAQPS